MQLTNLKELFTEDRAVSPVIGVILMVAITVILAAVIGTFVLGLGDDLQDTQPSASFNYDFNTTDNNVTISHSGGDSIDRELLNVTNGENVSAWNGTSDPVTAGSSTEYSNQGTWDGETVSVTWQSADGSSSATLATRNAPTA